MEAKANNIEMFCGATIQCVKNIGLVILFNENVVIELKITDSSSIRSCRAQLWEQQQQPCPEARGSSKA